MCFVLRLTDCVSWALVQHMKTFSLLLQLLAWPSSSLCLIKGGGKKKKSSLTIELEFEKKKERKKKGGGR